VTRSRVVEVVGAVVALVMLAVGVFLFFYRPSIEYMYIDLRDLSGSGGGNLWGILSVSVIIAVVLTLLVRKRRDRKAAP
jgi:hypothetical protein